MLDDPKIGSQKSKVGSAKLLCICFFDPAGILTVRENIGAWQRCSQFDIEVLNLWPGDGGFLTIPESIDLSNYHGLYIHPTASYNPNNLWSLDNKLGVKFENYSGIKILAKQDEHFKSAEFLKFIGTKKFDLLLSCVPESEVEKVYPEAKREGCRVFPTFTGYVSAAQRRIKFRPLRDRRVDVGYRGSIQPLAFGQLGWEKRQIGDRFEVHAKDYGLSTDISSEWSARFSGEAWYAFLQDIRSVLGVESGSNVFDFDGQLASLCESLEKQQGARLSRDELCTLAADTVLQGYEGNVAYGQISPRHFEAAAAYTVQVLYEGNYSGVFKPWQHFVPLKRDFSNMPEIVQFLQNEERATQMVHAARQELIDSDAYHYETFIAHLDETIEEILGNKASVTSNDFSRLRSSQETRPRAIILAAHDPVIDPRIEWFASSLSDRFRVLELGTYHWARPGNGPSVENVSAIRQRLRVECNRYTPTGIGPMIAGASNDLTAQAIWDRFRLIERASNAELEQEYGFYSAESKVRVRDLATYFLNVTAGLVEAARRSGGAELIVAADLETLLAGAILASDGRSYLLYDSHEYWPHSNVDFSAAEADFWSGVETQLVKLANERSTVSPPLAAALSNQYGVAFISVPNAVPKKSYLEPIVRAPIVDGPVDFLVQGNFAPSRGVEELIRAWPGTPSRARLILRGPDNPHKALVRAEAEKTGLAGSRILFPLAVDEAALVSAAAEASVGVIPYQPVNAGYKFCCPNKLSQYMASGLPIFANQTEFVGAFVPENGIGIVCDFSDVSAVSSAVRQFVEDVEFYTLASAKSHQSFVDFFNWEAVSEPLFESLFDAVEKHAQYRSFDTSWVDGGIVMREVAPGRGLMAAQIGAPTVTAEVFDKLSYKALGIQILRKSSILKGSWRVLPAKLRTSIVQAMKI